MHNELDEQIEHYRKKNFPEGYGLGECNVIVRRHCPIVERFNNDWWSEICRWSFRDQISFPYVLYKTKDLKVNFIKGNPRKHKYFNYKSHGQTEWTS